MEDNVYNDKMIEAYISTSNKTTWYKNTFQKYKLNNNKMTWNWSWWALFGGPFFLLYRKAYLAAIGLFILMIIFNKIPFLSFILWILSGGFSVYFVYQKYQIVKGEVERYRASDREHIDTIKEKGGYNTWAIWMAVILFVIPVAYYLFLLIIFRGYNP